MGFCVDCIGHHLRQLGTSRLLSPIVYNIPCCNNCIASQAILVYKGGPLRKLKNAFTGRITNLMVLFGSENVDIASKENHPLKLSKDLWVPSLVTIPLRSSHGISWDRCHFLLLETIILWRQLRPVL